MTNNMVSLTNPVTGSRYLAQLMWQMGPLAICKSHAVHTTFYVVRRRKNEHTFIIAIFDDLQTAVKKCSEMLIELHSASSLWDNIFNSEFIHIAQGVFGNQLILDMVFEEPTIAEQNILKQAQQIMDISYLERCFELEVKYES